jgi:hypothetical protein
MARTIKRTASQEEKRRWVLNERDEKMSRGFGNVCNTPKLRLKRSLKRTALEFLRRDK